MAKVGGGPGEQPFSLPCPGSAQHSWAGQRTASLSAGLWGRRLAGHSGEVGIATVRLAPAVMVVFRGRHLPALLGLFKKKGEWMWPGWRRRGIPDTSICQTLMYNGVIKAGEG